MPVRAVVSDMRKMHVGRGSPFFIQIYTLQKAFFKHALEKRIWKTMNSDTI